MPYHLRLRAPKKLNATLKTNCLQARFKTSKRTAADLIKIAKEKLPDLAECLVVEEENDTSYVKDTCCKKFAFEMQNLLAHLKTGKHQLALADDKNYRIESQKF